jgi:hypothetical protein
MERPPESLRSLATRWVPGTACPNSRLCVALLAAALGLAPGCTAPPPRETETARELRERLEEFHRRDGSGTQQEPYTVAVINRNLVYSARWGRVEDLAVTLQPIVENLYGPGARVVPHTASNKLFVYLPDPYEREHGAPRGEAGSATRGRPRGTPSVGGRSAGGRSARR